MTTCTDSILNNINISNINSGVKYSFDISPTSNKLYYVNIDTAQTIYINISNIDSNITRPLVLFTIFKKETLDAVITGRIDKPTILDINLSSGEYYICYRSIVGNYTFHVTYKYLKYATAPTFTVDIFHGESADFTIKTKRKEYECQQPLRYELYKSVLPSELVLEDSGRLHGRLPLIDVENVKDFPSYNLYDNGFSKVTPTGVRWEFKVKVYLEGRPETFDIRTFCLHIVNDWDLTKPNFDLIDITDETGNVEYDYTSDIVLCQPCNVDVITDDYYRYGENSIFKKLETDKWTYNNNNEITSGRYTSKTPLVNNISTLRHVISMFEFNGFNTNEYINITETLHNNTEIIMIPDTIEDEYNWIVNNIDDLSLSYSKKVLSDYIDKTILGKIKYYNDIKHLVLSYNEQSIQDIYENERISLLRNEPVTCHLDIIDTTLEAEITYESYN